MGTVLEGSVRKAGNRLRVTAQLVNVADGYQLWSERYDRQLEDVFAIQDETSLAIVNALRVKLLGEQQAVLATRHTGNVHAYELYLKGRHHWHTWSVDGFARSQGCMERAIAIDPDYAPAYTGLAECYLAAGGEGLVPYAGLNETGRAFEWLEKSYVERDVWLRMVGWDPMFAGVRGDPRMTDLLRRMGLPT